MRIRFIINPRSGRRQDGVAHGPAITRFAREHQLDAEVAVTTAAGHATRLAQQAIESGCTHVACLGGDGTLNEVAQALVGTPVALCLLPNGSGNGLARHLGIPTAPQRALQLLRPGAAQPAAIDTGTANGHFFCNVMGLGFDAAIAARFNQLSRRGLGGYVRTFLHAFAHRKYEHCAVATPRQIWSQDVLLLAVANSEQYGNGLRIAPGASVTDGQLDLVCISPISAWRGAALLARTLAGRPGRSEEYRRIRGEHFTLSRPAAGPVHTDGEVHETSAEVVVQVRTRSLNVMVPSDRTRRPPGDRHAHGGQEITESLRAL